MHGYARFAAMIGTSTLAMFGLMYLNTFQLDHLFFSETRVYMALVMGATMAIVMLAFMWHMHSHRWANLGIVAMSAIVTSERARISDPRARKLADQIIESQRGKSSK